MIKLIEFPSKFFNKIKWILYKNELKHIGINSHVDIGFSLKGEKYISIGDNFSMGENVSLHVYKVENVTEPKLVIGNDVTITSNSFISCASDIYVGNGVLFGSNVFVCDNFHGNNTLAELSIPPNKRDINIKGSVYIGENVWIGRNVCIMPGVKIGKGAIIGANSVVTHDISDNSVVVGAPAKVIRTIQ